MKHILVKIMGQIALLLAVAASGVSPAHAQDIDQAQVREAKERSAEGANSLQGTWEAQATIRNCQTGAVMENFSKLVSFETGGTAHETSSSSLFRSTAFGIWEQTGGPGSARYLLRFFRFNPDGTSAGSVRAVWNVTQRGNYYTAHASVEIIAPNGVTVATLCGAERGTQVEFPF